MIKIISAYTENLIDYIDISKPILEKYCKKHGYDHELFIIPNHYKRPYAWFKIEALLKQQNNTKHTLWMDADSVIVNTNFKIESLIKTNKYLYISKDMHSINTGVMLIANNEYMKNFLSEVWEQEDTINHCWWEQKAMINLLEKNYLKINDHIEYVQQNILNAYDYSQYQDFNDEGHINHESFIFHAPGLQKDIRLNLLKKYGYMNEQPRRYSSYRQ